MDDIHDAGGHSLTDGQVFSSGNRSCDKISLRDYVREAEPGASWAIRGPARRIRFNVVLEVAPSAASWIDDVDQIVSYRNIVKAIDGAMSSGRVDLLETLAERVARRCLADRRVLVVHVRIEKLNSELGTVGVEITRRGLPDKAVRIKPVEDVLAPRTGPRPVIVHLSERNLCGPDGIIWLNALATWERPTILVIEPDQPSLGPETPAQMRMAALAIEKSAWNVSDRDPRFRVLSSRAEIEASVRDGSQGVWAPSRMVFGVRGVSCHDMRHSQNLAAWLAGTIDAGLIEVDENPGAGSGNKPAQRVSSPGHLRLYDLADDPD